MFWLPRASFYKLCAKFKNSVGDHVFKSERKAHLSTKTKEVTDFHGGKISGKLQTAVYLKMMAGVSYLDIFMIYDVRYRQIYNFSKQ